MNVLVACEESQRVCIAFREKGHTAFSCDLLECSGGHPEWHIKQDVSKILNGNCVFQTMDGKIHQLNDRWDMIIAFPPCTYLSKAGARWLYHDGKIDDERYKKGLMARDFFMTIYNADCVRIAIENPRDMKIFDLPKFSQEIQPWQFGNPYSKATRLWLKNLEKLKPTNVVNSFRTFMPSNTGGAKRGQKHTTGIPKTKLESSKTFFGIAQAMADQWGELPRATVLLQRSSFYGKIVVSKDDIAESVAQENEANYEYRKK